MILRDPVQVRDTNPPSEDRKRLYIVGPPGGGDTFICEDAKEVVFGKAEAMRAAFQQQRIELGRIITEQIR